MKAATRPAHESEDHTKKQFKARLVVLEFTDPQMEANPNAPPTCFCQWSTENACSKTAFLQSSGGNQELHCLQRNEKVTLRDHLFARACSRREGANNIEKKRRKKQRHSEPLETPAGAKSTGPLSRANGCLLRWKTPANGSNNMVWKAGWNSNNRVHFHQEHVHN